jgi:hypothetical protein
MIPITGGLGKKHKGDDSDEEEAGAGGKGLAEALRNTIFAASVGMGSSPSVSNVVRTTLSEFNV